MTAFACNKVEYKDVGYFLGEYISLCGCCGGVIIEIDGENYRFDDVNKFNIDLEKVSTPFKVDLNWHKSETPYLCDEIIVEVMKKIKVF